MKKRAIDISKSRTTRQQNDSERAVMPQLGAKKIGDTVLLRPFSYTSPKGEVIEKVGLDAGLNSGTKKTWIAAHALPADLVFTSKSGNVSYAKHVVRYNDGSNSHTMTLLQWLSATGYQIDDLEKVTNHEDLSADGLQEYFGISAVAFKILSKERPIIRLSGIGESGNTIQITQQLRNELTPLIAALYRADGDLAVLVDENVDTITLKGKVYGAAKARVDYEHIVYDGNAYVNGAGLAADGSPACKVDLSKI